MQFAYKLNWPKYLKNGNKMSAFVRHLKLLKLKWTANFIRDNNIISSKLYILCSISTVAAMTPNKPPFYSNSNYTSLTNLR